jgi:hypothetical protein
MNCDIKQGLLVKKTPKDVQTLQNHMEILQSKPERVRKYFENEKISYAA